jgi:hypothetical protein
LECDGLTRIISTLMQRDGIEHRVQVGSLDVTGAGHIPLHWWIVLADEKVCDLRARMWLGDDPSVPHGVFVPEAHHHYTPANELMPGQVRLNPAMFVALAGKPMHCFPAFGNGDVPAHEP